MVERIYTIEKIKAILSPVFHEIPLAKAILFGSYARKEATHESDIDIYIDSNGKLNDWDFYEFCDKLTEKTDKKMDVIEKIDIDPSSSLYKTIQAEGITIYG